MSAGAGDQAAGLRARVARARGRVVAVTSGKGGVGKTALAASLGLELARRGRKVVLLDGDLGLANLAILFNVSPRRDLSHVVAGRARLADCAVPLRPGLVLLPAGTGVAELAELASPARQALLAEVSALAADADCLLVDTGAGIAATVLALLGLADRILLVTTPEPTALSDAYGLLKAAGERATRAELVVNLVTTAAQARQTHERLARLTERFLGFAPPLAAVIPRDEAVAEAVLRQEPLTVVYPYAPATRAIAALARRLDPSPGTHDATPSVPLAVPVRR
jgi:flagellar biosynthesis protein FlhG